MISILGEENMNLDELKEKRKNVKINTEKIIHNLGELSKESNRVANLAHNSKDIIEGLDAEFERQTGLDKTDIKFLFFATALQIGRWIIINKLNECITEKIDNSRLKDNDPIIKKMEKDKENKYLKKHEKWKNIESDKYPTWQEIVSDGVPYDVTVGAPNFGVNMEGGYHRIHTLGHDPIMGWIFGTMNIISSTITIDDFRTYKISKKPKHWECKSNVAEGFRMTIESIKEDSKRLPAAIFKQAVHLKTDVYTKLGLPVPVIEIFSLDFAGELYKSNYDLIKLIKDVAVIGTQAGVSLLINMIITLIHGLFYDSNRYDNRSVYEVKTRKILLYSNLISTMSNVIWVGGNMLAGNEKAVRDLDIGGIIVTMYRLVTDSRFIQKIKEEFIFEKFNSLISGDELRLEEIRLWDC